LEGTKMYGAILLDTKIDGCWDIEYLKNDF